jgi:DNA polymerase-3 subunit delta
MADTLTADSIRRQLRKGEAAPVYLLHGEEGFYTDLIAKEIENLVAPDDRDFDLTMLYATQASPAEVIEAARRYPMMSQRQVVIVREIQSGYQGGMTSTAYLNALAPYVKAPSPTTVLCLCCRGAQAKGAEFMKAIKEGKGVVLESKKLNERMVASTVSNFIAGKGLSADPKALAMLCDFVGTDLSRLYNEVEKLTMTLGKGAMVTPEAVESNIGISKEYNNFELVSAIARHDSQKTFRIINRFAADPKNNPPQVLVVNLFNLFSNLLCAHYCKDKSEHGLMQELGFRFPGQLTDVRNAMKWCGPWQTIEIISLLREFDGASKGNGSRQNQFDLLHDLCFHILNPIGSAGVKW